MYVHTKVKVKIEPEKLGVHLAHANSEFQAAFFNALSKEFEVMGSYAEEMQLLFVGDELSECTKAFFRKLPTYITSEED